MSTNRITRQTAPLRCTSCSDDDGPFTKAGLCEDCTPAAALRSALEDGGHLDEDGLRLMNNYAADVLRDAADMLRTVPGCESAARIVDSLAAGRTA
ncbi:hypothetical protein [Streptomyces venezuelae]|uniref:Uncharacterized protein n=1 Tax=Streptomyces venezuelae TaxID=54571 RepID=A0A5P2B628_STRVZ|nr:hypothetical protein [Streptomyces venezuelae]QES25894.1 hypothetical protein DEJ47_04970 [Streptomyces venezuelae]